MKTSEHAKYIIELKAAQHKATKSAKQSCSLNMSLDNHRVGGSTRGEFIEQILVKFRITTVDEFK